jgi:hypothetical protein
MAAYHEPSFLTSSKKNTTAKARQSKLGNLKQNIKKGRYRKKRTANNNNSKKKIQPIG